MGKIKEQIILETDGHGQNVDVFADDEYQMKQEEEHFNYVCSVYRQMLKRNKGLSHREQIDNINRFRAGLMTN